MTWPAPTCQTCNGTGCESTYWGVVTHPYGQMKIDGEKRHPLLDLPGGAFYGGSSHKQCSTCKGSGYPSVTDEP